VRGLCSGLEGYLKGGGLGRCDIVDYGREGTASGLIRKGVRGVLACQQHAEPGVR
jgi:hypothetical protein